MYNTNLENEYKNDKLSLEELLKENISYSQSILQDTQKIKRYMLWRLIFNIVWLILVIAPIVVAFFWLPSFMSDFIQQFQGLTSDGQNTFDLLKQLEKLK